MDYVFAMAKSSGYVRRFAKLFAFRDSCQFGGLMGLPIGFLWVTPRVHGAGFLGQTAIETITRVAGYATYFR